MYYEGNACSDRNLCNWQVYYGDCLEVLKQWPANVVDFVYLDPPFNSKADYNVLYGSRNGASAQTRVFSDKWHWDAAAAERMENLERAPARRSHKVLTGIRAFIGDCGMLAYLSYMAERLEVCRRVMTDRANIYLHYDPTASHYLKLVCDGVFGPDRFKNEIVWKRTSGRSDAKRYGRVHDVILYYAEKGAVWRDVQAWALARGVEMDGWWCVRHGDALAWVEAPSAMHASA